MKLVMGIIKPGKLDEVREALSAVGVSGLTVTEVKGYGRHEGHREVYRGAAYTVSFEPMLRVEVAVPEALERAAVDAIAAAARTGGINDGRIFVTTLTNVVRIRTGEVDGEAI